MRRRATSSGGGLASGANIAVCTRSISELRHHVEHIVPRQHGGSDDLENLALACHRYNLHRGPNLAGIDPNSGEIASLFHPRRDRWSANFAFEGARITGISAVGRATVEVLNMNDARRLELRAEILKYDRFI